jgi:hypothetical protein
MKVLTWWAVVALAIVAAGCGGGDSGGGQVASLDGSKSAAKTGTVKKTDPATAMRAFARCMRAHGVDMADPKVDSSGKGLIQIGPGPAAGGASPARPDEKKLQTAQRACQHFMDAAQANGGKRPDPAQEAKARRQALAFARCMREHGVDMPDPQFEGNGAITQKVSGSQNGRAFEAANKACMKKVGMRGGFGVMSGKSGS